jgi:hypothetical protein
MATGENSGTWGNVTNANLGDAIEQALVESADITFASNNVTLTLSDSNSRQNARALRLNLTGTTAGARDLIVPAIQKPYLINNGTADTVTVKVSGQTGVAVPASTSMLLYNNGTDVGLAFNRVVANVVGNVTGNITGNVTGNVTGDVSGNVTGNTTGTHTGPVAIGANTITTTGWTVGQTGDNLTFSHGGTVRFSISSTGAVVAQNNVTAFGTPA